MEKHLEHFTLGDEIYQKLNGYTYIIDGESDSNKVFVTYNIIYPHNGHVASRDEWSITKAINNGDEINLTKENKKRMKIWQTMK